MALLFSGFYSLCNGADLEPLWDPVCWSGCRWAVNYSDVKIEEGFVCMFVQDVCSIHWVILTYLEIFMTSVNKPFNTYFCLSKLPPLYYVGMLDLHSTFSLSWAVHYNLNYFLFIFRKITKSSSKNLAANYLTLKHKLILKYQIRWCQLTFTHSLMQFF